MTAIAIGSIASFVAFNVTDGHNMVAVVGAWFIGAFVTWIFQGMKKA